MNFKSIFTFFAFAILLVSCEQANEQLLEKANNLCNRKEYEKTIIISAPAGY
jgi:hypothetical protein